MAFFGKQFVKLTGKWIPVSKSVSNYDAKRLAKDIEKECTVSETDVIAVLNAIPNVMTRYLAEGHSVKLDGIGSFHLSFECKKTGVDTPEEGYNDIIILGKKVQRINIYPENTVELKMKFEQIYKERKNTMIKLPNIDVELLVAFNNKEEDDELQYKPIFIIHFNNMYYSSG